MGTSLILCSTPPTFRVDVRAWQKIQAFGRDGDTSYIELFKGIVLRTKRYFGWGGENRWSPLLDAIAEKAEDNTRGGISLPVSRARSPGEPMRDRSMSRISSEVF